MFGNTAKLSPKCEKNGKNFRLRCNFLLTISMVTEIKTDVSFIVYPEATMKLFYINLVSYLKLYITKDPLEEF